MRLQGAVHLLCFPATSRRLPCPLCLHLQPKEIGLPFTAYYAVDEVREVGAGQGQWAMSSPWGKGLAVLLVPQTPVSICQGFRTRCVQGHVGMRCKQLGRGTC